MFMFGKSWNFYWVMFTNVFHSYGQLPEGKGEYKSSNLMGCENKERINKMVAQHVATP